jgi:NAD(P)-dependent dehydrogenase (short-subunit alcohol dehydrogenase family)
MTKLLIWEAGFSSYAASKGAIVAFGRALAVDHAKDNIHVNVICPGDTNTPIFGTEWGIGREHLTRIIHEA